MSQQRIEWMDSFKGFGMCCVVLSHMTVSKILVKWMFSFHMPLFFFASGYLYGSRQPTAQWVLKKIDGLLIPYLIFTAFAFVTMPYTLGGKLLDRLPPILEFRGLDLHGSLFACLSVRLLAHLLICF